MKILYIGTNLRMKSANPSAPAIRAMSLQQGLAQVGAEIVTLMSGDKISGQGARNIYQRGLKQFLPSSITAMMRDAYEIIYDRRLYPVVKTALEENKPDIIWQKHSRYSRVGVRAGREFGVPTFLDDITPVWEGEMFSDRSLKPVARYFRQQTFAQASGLIAVSQEIRDQLLAEGVSAHKIHFVPNGVDITLFNPKTTSLQISEKYNLTDKIVVGYIGGFQQWHRLDFFMSAACDVVKANPKLHFLLVGNDENGRIQSIAQEKGVADRFTFPGGVHHTAMPAYLQAMDIAVLPGTLKYMSPIKIYEYMAMKKPVIAPNRNSITEEIVIPYKNGLLFEADNKNSLKDAIIALATNPELRQTLGTNGRTYVEQNFTWRHQANHLIEAFQTVLMTP